MLRDTQSGHPYLPPADKCQQISLQRHSPAFCYSVLQYVHRGTTNGKSKAVSLLLGFSIVVLCLLRKHRIVLLHYVVHPNTKNKVILLLLMLLLLLFLFTNPICGWEITIRRPDVTRLCENETLCFIKRRFSRTPKAASLYVAVIVVAGVVVIVVVVVVHDDVVRVLLLLLLLLFMMMLLEYCCCCCYCCS